MRGRKASIITKLVVLGLVIYTSTTLISLQRQIAAVEAERGNLEQVVATLERENEIYEREIEHRDDQLTIERIARSRYGLVMPGERIFRGTAN